MKRAKKNEKKKNPPNCIYKAMELSDFNIYRITGCCYYKHQFVIIVGIKKFPIQVLKEYSSLTSGVSKLNKYNTIRELQYDMCEIGKDISNFVSGLKDINIFVNYNINESFT